MDHAVIAEDMDPVRDGGWPGQGLAATGPSHAKPRQLSELEWDEAKATWRRHYLPEGRRLHDVMDNVRQERNPSFTKRQLTKRSTKWKFKKSVTTRESRRVAPKTSVQNNTVAGPSIPATEILEDEYTNSLTGWTTPPIGLEKEENVSESTTRSAHLSTNGHTPSMWLSLYTPGSTANCSPSPASPIVFTPTESNSAPAQEEHSPERCVKESTHAPTSDESETLLLQRLFSALCLAPLDNSFPFFQPSKGQEKMLVTSDTVSWRVLEDVDRSKSNHFSRGASMVVRRPPPSQANVQSALKQPHIDAIFASAEIVFRDPLEFELYPFPYKHGNRSVATHEISISKHHDSLRREIDECLEASRLMEVASLKHTDAALTLIERLAVAHFTLGHYNEAERFFNRVLPAAERLHGPHSVYVISLKRDLVEAVMHLSRYAEANQLAQEVYSSALKVDDSVGHLVQKSMHVLAQSYGNLGDLENEDELLRQLIQIQLVDSGPRDGNTLAAIRSLCDSMVDAKRHAESEELLRIAIQLSHSTQGLSNKRRCLLHRKLATVLFKQGKWDESETVYRTTVDMSERLLGPDHPDTLRCKFWFAKVLRTLGFLEESYAVHLPTVEKQIETRGEQRPSTIESMASFSVTLVEMDRMSEAEAWMRTALRCSQQTGLITEAHVTDFWNRAMVLLVDDETASTKAILDLFEHMACKVATLVGPGSRSIDEMLKWDHKDRRTR